MTSFFLFIKTLSNKIVTNSFKLNCNNTLTTDEVVEKIQFEYQARKINSNMKIDRICFIDNDGDELDAESQRLYDSKTTIHVYLVNQVIYYLIHYHLLTLLSLH